MLGNHDVPKSLPGIVSGGRAAMLAFALATATSFFAIGSAQAQDCEGGFRMLKDEIPVACEGGSGQSSVTPTVPVQSEPLHTGSINDRRRQRRRDSVIRALDPHEWHEVRRRLRLQRNGERKLHHDADAL